MICSTDEVRRRGCESERDNGREARAGALDAVAGSMTATLAGSVQDGDEVFVSGVLEAMTGSIIMRAEGLRRDVRVRAWIVYRN